MQIPRIFLFFLLPIFLLNFSGTPDPSTENIPAYGGVFRMNLTEDFRSLYPPSVIEYSSRHIASQIYEGLVKCDPNSLELRPSLAQSWSVNSTSDEFTFRLRTNVYFQDDVCFTDGKGRKLVAADIKYCFEQLCKDSPYNFGYLNTFKGLIKNNDSFKAINDSTFSIRTTEPCSYMLSILTQPCCWIYPREAHVKYGEDMRVRCVGTGPFYVKTIKEGEAVVLQRNANYWRTDGDGNKLPYLNIIKFTFIKDKQSELIAFRNQELDMLAQPDMEMVFTSANETLTVQPAPTFKLLTDTALSVTFYGFLHNKIPFNNVKVRQAFCHAINKQTIADYALHSSVIPAFKGFIPPGIPGYTNTDVGYEFDIGKARKLLKEAGYPNGKDFPEITLQINSGGGERNRLVAETIIDMLKENLGVTVEIDVMPFTQHLYSAETGKATFWRWGWICDYPDPRVFLHLAYGKNVPKDPEANSSINSMRFKNAEFDAAFERGSAEGNESLRMAHYRNAETIAMNNAFICPLYFETYTQLVSINVQNYHINGLDVRDLSEVWFGK